LPPPGVLVGGGRVDDVDRCEGRTVVDGLGGAGRDDELGLGTGIELLGLGTGLELLGLGMTGGLDGRGGEVPPSVGVLTWLPSQ
jgi:hypothetical protein